MDLPRLESQIKQAEGIRLVAYKDSLGLWTAGVGHLLPQNRDWTGQRFSVAQVATWLEEDLITAQKLSAGLLEWPLMDTDARQMALIELVFNMGLSHWRQFALARKAMSEKNWPEASKQLLSSLWAKQVGPIRSNRLAKQIESGEFPQ
jgi:lysozyme